MNAPLSCVAMQELARHMRRVDMDAASYSVVETKLDELRTDGDRLFDALGDMEDDTLRQFCALIAKTRNPKLSADDRAWAGSELDKLIDRVNTPHAEELIEAEAELYAMH